MLQEPLSALAQIPTEHKVTRSLDKDELIERSQHSSIVRGFNQTESMGSLFTHFS